MGRTLILNLAMLLLLCASCFQDKPDDILKNMSANRSQKGHQ